MSDPKNNFSRAMGIYQKRQEEEYQRKRKQEEEERKKTEESITGTYTSAEGQAIGFNMIGEKGEKKLIVFELQGYSKALDDLNLGRVIYKMRVIPNGHYITLQNESIERFKDEVLDKGTQWTVKDKNGNEKTIPGTWSSTAKGGKRRGSMKRRRSLRKKRHTRKH